jgi:hypothetical protein
MFALLLIAGPLLGVAALMSKARQARRLPSPAQRGPADSLGGYSQDVAGHGQADRRAAIGVLEAAEGGAADGGGARAEVLSARGAKSLSLRTANTAR